MDTTPESANGPKLIRLLMWTITLSSMSALMFNIVLPQVSDEFQISYAQASWLTSGYTIIYAFGTVTYGKLADRKGNAFLFLIASGSLFVCFILLSSFAGVSPYWIAAFLLFGNVGQSFMSIAMSNSISRTLPREQVGVGMELFSMLNFIAQGMAVGVYGIAVEFDAAMS